MEQATGLSEHQIRHRRRKPEYAKYLENAIFTIVPKPTAPEAPPITLISPTPGPNTPNRTPSIDTACNPNARSKIDFEASGSQQIRSSPQPTGKRKASSPLEKPDVRKHRPSSTPMNRQMDEEQSTEDSGDPSPPNIGTPEIRSSSSTMKRKGRPSPDDPSPDRRTRHRETPIQSPGPSAHRTRLDITSTTEDSRSTPARTAPDRTPPSASQADLLPAMDDASVRN